MELNLTRLRMLREVAHRGSITAAARSLSYSPSGISQQIAALEHEVDAALLQRVGRGIRLTEVGRVLADHADIILDAESTALAAVESARDSFAERLKVGVFATIAAGLLPAVIAALQVNHPELEIETREVDPEDAIADIRLGHLDLAFLIDYPEASEPWPASLGVVQIGSEDFQVATPTGRLDNDRPRLSDLADFDWIISGPETYYGRAVRTACARAGFEPRVKHQVNEQATALAMVAAGLGITLMSELGRTFVPDGVQTHPLRRGLRRHLLIAHHPPS
ncbi:MAG: LysR family transcriptional regulator, partial [Actinomycetota bacterium]|nr:LysR family transcriptional regulator [Actinomycetota bacterium]